MADPSGPVAAQPRRPLDPRSIRGATEDEVLRRFVASVRRWRARDGSSLLFRGDDLLVLAATLGTDPTDVERRLIQLTGCDQATATRLRRLLLVGLASLPIAPAALAVGAPAEVLDTAPVAIVVDAPDRPTAPEALVIAPPVVPLRAPLAPGSEATVSIPRLGLELPVASGGQEVIDDGLVAHYWAPGWREPAAAGAAGTYWLAAHHETHGSPFLLLPEVVVGDQIDVATATQTFTYTVTSTEVVEDDAGFGPVYGADPVAPVILVQTCLDEVRRLLVHGALTATA
jgi:LPXTG-site transpeptidase (sortase) family protein